MFGAVLIGIDNRPKRQAKFVADEVLFFFFFIFHRKVEISFESSAQQMIHMKCQDLLSMKSKTKSKF